MDEIFKIIKERRSVRNFSDKPIKKELLQKIIDAGNQAPSGGNVQPWRFVVISDSKVKKQLVTNAIPIYKKWLEGTGEEFQKMRKSIDDVIEDSIYYKADVVVFVIGTGEMAFSMDCPMVCQNMMLAARALGIGSCWTYIGQMGVNDEIKKILEMKEEEQIFGPIVMGYPEGDFPEAPIKKEANVKYI